jgi:hypothetical protein
MENRTPPVTANSKSGTSPIWQTSLSGWSLEPTTTAPATGLQENEMREPILSGKTTFTMRHEDKGQWTGKWVIDNSKTGRVHLILDSEEEADEAMDGIKSNAMAYADLLR